MSEIDTATFTPEQQLELAEVQARRAEATARASENERVVHELQKENSPE